MDEHIIELKSKRKFGVEFEVNSFDNRDFIKFPLNKDLQELPYGSYEIANLISNNISKKTVVKTFERTHNNNFWVVKPDRTCGIEICSPVLTKRSINKICKLCDLFKKDKNIIADERCSFHVHVEIFDKKYDDILEMNKIFFKIISYWIKFEAVFLDSVPEQRKMNPYCKSIGLSGIFDYYYHNNDLYLYNVIKKLGEHKYYTINCFQYFSIRKRNTIEFRIAENNACIDSKFAKNWVKLLLHFVECAIQAPDILPYNGDPRTGFCWLDLLDLVEFLKLSNNYNISKELKEVRNWFIARIFKNVTNNNKMNNVWSIGTRKNTLNQLSFLKKEFGIKDFEKYL